MDRVFVAQSAESLGASSAEQFYVSISRARDSVLIYTDDKARLAEAILSSGARMTAHELLRVPIIATSVDPFEAILRERANVSSPEPRRQDLRKGREHSIEKIHRTEAPGESQQISPLPALNQSITRGEFHFGITSSFVLPQN